MHIACLILVSGNNSLCECILWSVALASKSVCAVKHAYAVVLAMLVTPAFLFTQRLKVDVVGPHQSTRQWYHPHFSDMNACQLHNASPVCRTLRRSRHHCRLCGQIFCHACSDSFLLLPPRFQQPHPQRTCTACAVLLEPLQPFLAGVSCDLRCAAFLCSWLLGDYWPFVLLGSPQRCNM